MPTPVEACEELSPAVAPASGSGPENLRGVGGPLGLRQRQARTRRRHDERITRETLVQRAAHLPDSARALINAHYSLGMAIEELALVHRVTPRQMRRRIERLRDTLSDPCFLLAVRFANKLPRELAELVRDHWIIGATLRQMAAGREQTLHRVRHDLAVARSLLVVAMSGEQNVPPDLARAAIDARRR